MSRKIATVMLVMLFSVSGVAALTQITGQVFDSSGNPIVGATVTSSCNLNPGGPTSTGAGGYYSISYSESACGLGDTATVTATYNGKSGEASGVVGDAIVVRLAYIPIGLEIPEFATIAIPGLIALGGYITFRRKRRAN